MDKVTKKTLRFLTYPTNSENLAADYCGFGILLDHDEVEKTTVDWERGMVHCVLTRHP